MERVTTELKINKADIHLLEKEWLVYCLEFYNFAYDIKIQCFDILSKGNATVGVYNNIIYYIVDRNNNLYASNKVLPVAFKLI